MLSETLYTVHEAAKAYHLSHWTVWDLLKRGKLMRTKVAGKTFIRESELDKLVVDIRKDPHAKARVRKGRARELR